MAAVTRIYNVVSPHLDDAALSCSLFLAANPGSYVTTVFAAGPPSVRPLTVWDGATRYFRDGANVAGVRRGEDISATALVGASSIHLTYWDRQYRNGRYGYTGVGDEDLPSVIAADLARRCQHLLPEAWVIPLGLGHADHRLAAEACLIWAEHNDGDVYVYEELPYAVEDLSDAMGRKLYLGQRGFTLEEDTTLAFAHDRALKAAVFRCHASQRRPLRRRARIAMRTPERIWKLCRRQRDDDELLIKLARQASRR